MITQLPMFPPDADWRLPSLGELPSWAQAKRVAIDIETCDPELEKLGPGVRRGAFICGVAVAIEDGPSFYLPVRHQNGENLPVDGVLAYLRDQARVFQGPGRIIVGANLPYDLDFLLEEGVEFQPEFFRDVQVAEPLLDELQMFYNLDAVAERWGLPGKDHTLLQQGAEAYGFSTKKELWRLPPKYVGAYAERDVNLPLALLRKQERAIDDQELWDVYDLESRLLPVLVRMRRRGVRISHDQLDRVEAWSLEQETATLAEVKRQTGVKISVGDVWKAKALAPALKAIGIDPPRTPKTNAPSIKVELLESIDHEVAGLLLRARQVNKVRTTFAASVRRFAIGDRIHCELRQLRGAGSDTDDDGTRYGRLSSKNPNLQQQPARDPEIGPMWRAVYIPDEGGEWLVADYSQQEPRWLTHYAELANCAGAAAAAERYRTDPSTDNHQMMSDLCSIPRKQAKILFLGKCYGMGGAKLCHDLGLSTKFIPSRRDGKMIEVAGPEGQAIIDQFDRRAPYVKQLSYRCQKKAQRTGFIRTVLGRHCRFPKNAEGGYEWTHKALNRLIQGSSADQTKTAMVEADAAGIPIQLQVHDELDMTIWDRAEIDPLAAIMRDCVPCNVPVVIDAEVGPDWGHIK